MYLSSFLSHSSKRKRTDTNIAKSEMDFSAKLYHISKLVNKSENNGKFMDYMQKNYSK